MFRVSTIPIIRSTQNWNYRLRYWSYFFVQLPPSNVAKLAWPNCRIINSLYFVASRWTFINIVSKYSCTRLSLAKQVPADYVTSKNVLKFTERLISANETRDSYSGLGEWNSPKLGLYFLGCSVIFCCFDE